MSADHWMGVMLYAIVCGAISVGCIVAHSAWPLVALIMLPSIKIRN